MMTSRISLRPASSIFIIIIIFFLAATVSVAPGQITSIEGDGVLNAPYRGTITSLRQATLEIAHGEVMSHVEPVSGGTLEIISTSIEFWAVGTWDRSLLRLYEGLDASGSEIDLTGSSSSSPVLVPKGPHTFTRFSIKAIATKSLAPQVVTFHVRYQTTGGTVDVDRSFTVVPTTGSFHPVGGEHEAFLLSTVILDVAVGNARLTVPTGRTAEMIGAAYIWNDSNIGNSDCSIPSADCLLPGAAESLYFMNSGQFQTSTSSSGPNKTNYGTPWPGHLIGYRTGTDIFGPDNTHWDPRVSGSVNGLRRVDDINPYGIGPGSTASQRLEYNNDTDDVLLEIHDHASPQNSITLDRTGDVVDRITTSDGRSWTIQSDPSDGWITGVVPDSGIGARYFKYDAGGRVIQVRLGADDGGDPGDPDVGQDIMYKFVYDVDGDLREEWRYVDGQLRKVVEHIIVNEGLRQRRDYTSAGEYRQTDLVYDTADGLNHRLATIRTYEGLNGTGTPRETVFTHDIDNPDGTMSITQVDLPDGTTLDHEYDVPETASNINFGFRSKTTLSKGGESQAIWDVEYDFFYPYYSDERLYQSPRLVKQRDGRGVLSEVVYEYEEGGWPAYGELRNRLLRITGPTITQGISGTRIPETRLTYLGGTCLVERAEIDISETEFHAIEHQYDSLFRQTASIVDPGGLNLTTTYLYCDSEPTQDRATVDPDGYWSWRRYADAGRLISATAFLDADVGDVGQPCNLPDSAHYETTYAYDAHGRLTGQVVQNKDRDGNDLSPATIATTFSRDRLGWTTAVTRDPGGVGQVSNTGYNWLGEIKRAYDTSGRGMEYAYDGRGLKTTATPLALGQTLHAELATTYTWDPHGRPASTFAPTGAEVRTIRDDLGRVMATVRVPGSDGGQNIATLFEYDDADNVTRTTLRDGYEFGSPASGTVLSDETAFYDEGSFNYETRIRTVAGADMADDPVTQFTFDWAGKVVEERMLRGVGDDSFTAYAFDAADRLETLTDSEGGETVLVRDDRGNVLSRTVKLDVTNTAVASATFDALGRATTLTYPEDSAGHRAWRNRDYDSRGNLLRETANTYAGVPLMTRVIGYDNVSRQTRVARLADASSVIDAAGADPAIDRVVDLAWDADGRLQTRFNYNNDTITAHTTIVGYDDLGRLSTVEDPSGSTRTNNFATNGRLDNRVIFDGLGNRTFAFDYDGHDRVISQTAQGTPDLTTSFGLDGLDRQVTLTSPRAITTETQFDLVGRTHLVTEDLGGDLERATLYAYSRLGRLTTQTAANSANDGSALPDQLTTYRYDTLGRPTRVLYPDSPDHGAPENCTDCIRTTWDLAGRIATRTDPRGFLTLFEHDNRGLVLSRTTDDARDTFAYDALGRITTAQRGTIAEPATYASSSLAWTDLGDLDYEDQTIAGGVTRRTDYGHDQAGNRSQLTYPGGVALAYTPTAINQVDTISLDGGLLVDYDYNGRVLDKRRTTTDDPSGNIFYAHLVGYDDHRRINNIANILETPVKGQETIADYVFTRDDDGNPLTQITEGMPDFEADDRTFTVDDLNRLTGTAYHETSSSESAVLDLVGNREQHAGRDGSTASYTLSYPPSADTANEYATINGEPVSYDAAGNLAVDEDGRQYSYDERNRLTQIEAADSSILVAYTYDALGRRVTATFDPATANERVVHYYHDGQSVIEERNGGSPPSEPHTRYHVNGPQYIDERVVTFTESTKGRDGEFTYYLSNLGHSIAGTGNADGSVIERLDYTTGGDFVEAGGTTCTPGDVNNDGPIDGLDIQFFINVLLGHDTDPDHICAADIDESGTVDIDDVEPFVQCLLLGECEFAPLCTPGDLDDDGDVNPADIPLFVNVLLLGPANEFETCAADLDGNGHTDGEDIQPFLDCILHDTCPPPVDPGKSSSAKNRAAPTSGTFTLHGRPIDVLSDGKTLIYIRARYYDPKHGRWLQRDPKGYVDGNNLYESFGGNPQVNQDPEGAGILTWLAAGAWDASDWEFVTDGGPFDAWVGGVVESGRTIKSGAVEFGRIFTGESAMQLRVVRMVDAEFALGGTASESESYIVVRAVSLGVTDFFGASNVATAVIGEAVVFGEQGNVFIIDPSGFERVQAGVAGVGQFAGGVSGFGGGGLNQAVQLSIARSGIQTFSRVAPANTATRVFVFRTSLAIESRQFALNAAATAPSQGLAQFLGRASLTPRAASRFPNTIVTRHGIARQARSAEALSLQQDVAFGRGVFRAGSFPKSAAGEAQFFSPRNPLTTPDFANRVGAAGLGSSTPDFIMGGRVKLGSPFVTRPAPRFGRNLGGDLEIVTLPGGVEIEFFVMP